MVGGLQPQRDGDAPPKIAGRYRTSPSERPILGFVGRVGIPRSVFLGRQRRSVTEHYDPDGNLTGYSVTTSDPEWLPDDQNAALEYDAEQSVLHSCGHPLDETSNPENAPAYFVERFTCAACAALERAEENDRKERLPGQRRRVRKRI